MLSSEGRKATSRVSPSRTIVTTAVVASPAWGACTAASPTAGGMPNRSMWMRSAARPAARRAASASSFSACGPHTKASSTGPDSRSSVAIFSASSRPECSGESTPSREKTGCRLSRARYRFFRSSSSSLNMVLAAVRLPYSSVQRACGSRASTVFSIDRIGVMPLPPATASTWCGRRCSAAPNRPCGGITSSTSPTFRCPCSQVVKAPPGTRRTPTRSGSPAAAQME